jgi:sodium borate transporter 11
MHGILPQSPLHVVGMADFRDGRIAHVRETRITSIVCNLLILWSLRLVPYPLGYIPVPVLDGLFLYCAVSSLRGSSLFARICLPFTESRHFPDAAFTRQCRRSRMHTFTILQLLQLVAIIAVGYAPNTYVQMAFPVVIAMLIPLRHLIVPCFVNGRDLQALEKYD